MSPTNLSKEKENWLNQEKQSFFIVLNTIIKNAPLFGFENKNILEGVERFFHHKKAIFETEGELIIRFGYGILKMNDWKVPLDNAVVGILNKLSEDCEPFCLNLITFEKDLNTEELSKFVLYIHHFQLKELSTVQNKEEAYELFIKGFQALALKNIQCGRVLEAVPQSQEELTDGEIAIRLYFRACMMVREMIHNFASADKFQQRKMKTLIKSILESLQKDSYYLVALTHCKYFQQDTEICHLVNTAIFSALIGMSLDISRGDLGDLVLCSFLHDIGSSAAMDYINTPPEEFLSQSRKKDSNSMKRIASLFQTSDTSDSLLRSVVVAVECHFKEKLQNSKKRSLFSRVISIASDYDRLVTRNPHTRSYKCTPQEALNYLHTHSKNRHLEAYDPALFKVFFQVMGLFPIGTLVQLSSGAFAMIVAQQEDVALSNQPFVRLFADNAGQKVDEVLDLSQEDSLGPDRFRIQQSINFEYLNMTLEDFLFIITK